MLKLKEVENAKAVMTEAVNWSVMKWLAEKKKVRKAADIANDALDTLDVKVKAAWSDELKLAYDELPPINPAPKSVKPLHNGNSKKVPDASTKALAKSIKHADQEAYRARMDAEDTFDLAEKRLSTSMAREGTKKAIASWELHEKAIVKSQAAMSAENRAL